MGRSRYVITEPSRPHFLTCTVLEWLPVFTRPETGQIVLDRWKGSINSGKTVAQAELILSDDMMREKLDYSLQPR